MCPLLARKHFESVLFHHNQRGFPVKAIYLGVFSSIIARQDASWGNCFNFGKEGYSLRAMCPYLCENIFSVYVFVLLIC